MEPSDADLMLRVQQGDSGAFEELVRRYQVPILGYLRHMSAPQAEDLFQETFLRVFRSRQSYCHPDPVRPWLFAIARNVWFSRSDAERREQEKRAALTPAEPKNPDESWERREAAREVDAALRTLPPRQREAMLLRFHQGLSYLEIAAVMEVSSGTVAGWLSDGVARLSKLLKGTR
jgi:RNA polymerase sigma-70 factor (ECF subfamily)